MCIIQTAELSEAKMKCKEMSEKLEQLQARVSQVQRVD